MSYRERLRFHFQFLTPLSGEMGFGGEATGLRAVSLGADVVVLCCAIAYQFHVIERHPEFGLGWG
jgi:hypothetical protein